MGWLCNFFQYQPSPASYSTISGTVWNDLNGNGTNDPGEPGLANIELDLVQDVNSNGLAEAGEPVAASALTDANGNYSFAGVTPGSYVVRETDLYGYYNSGDAQPPNDGQVAISASGGAAFTNVWFLEHLNQPPTASNDVFAVAENVPSTLYPLANDTDPDGNPLTITAVTTTNGTVNFANGTNLLFTPGTNFLGALTLNYSISDGHGGTASASIFVTVTNVPPLANPDFYSVAENTTNTFSPLTNDVVLTPGGTLTLLGVSATNGVATISGTNVIFTPTLNFVGIATIGYTIKDNVGGTNSSLITVNVTNLPPTAFGQAVATTENTAKAIALTGSDPTSLPLTFIIVSGPANGTLSSLNPNTGAVTYTPNPNYTGADTFTFRVNNGYNNSPVATVNVAVTNIPPQANPDAYAVSENTTNTLSPLGNDVFRTPGGSLSLVSVSPTNGTATISGTNVSFVPTVNFVGVATIGYTITDNVGGTNSSLITVTVTNRPPVANPDSYSVSENSTNTLSPLVNDLLRTPGGHLTLIGVSPTNGTASISGTNVIFISTLNFVGTATIGYTITDNVGGTNSSLITITVSNLPPVAFSQTVAMTENTARGITLAGSDPTSLPLTFILVTGPTNGTLTSINTNTGAATYTPNANYTGADTFTFRVNNGYNTSLAAAVNLTVTNIPPLANPDSDTVLENSTNTFSPLTNDVVQTPGGTLALVSVSATNGTATISGTNVVFTPANNFTGVATIGYTITDGLGGSNSSLITVTVLAVADIAVSKSGPANVYAGTNFDYIITVTNLGPGAAASLSVTDNLPSAVGFVSATTGTTINGSLVVWTNLGSLAAGAATNLTVTVTAPVTGASLTNLAAGGSPTSDPNPTNNTSLPVFTGVTPLADVSVSKTGPAGIIFGTNFSYTISVTNFGPSIATAVSVTDSLPAGLVFVSSVPATTTNASSQVIWPDLGDFAANTGTSLTLTVFSTARGMMTNIATGGSPVLDPDPTNNQTPPVVTAVTNNPPLANPDFYSVAENTTNTFSTLTNDVVLTPGGSLTFLGVSATNGTAMISGTNVIFIPTPNFIGIATIGYTITDNVGGTSSSLITVTVSNLPPLANPDFYGIGENSGINSFSPLVNDLAPTAGGSLTIISVSPTNGTASISGTNVLFAPATNFLGTATVGYTITDNVGGTNTGLITVAVTNRTPVAVNDAAATPKNVAVTIPVLVNDSDPDFNPLAIVSVSPTNGTAGISGTNVVFTPAVNFLGTATVGYTITDGNGGTNAALISIAVTNRPPVAVNDFAGTPENVVVTIPVLANDFDPDGDALTIVSVSPTNGTASISGTNVLFTPANNFIGTTFVGYTITDGFGGTNAALVTVTVTNLPPVATPDTYAVAENTTNAFAPLVNDVVGTPGGTLAVIGVNPTNGTATIAGTNVIFTPANNFLGTATIGYTITDNVGGTNNSVITVTVTNVPPVANPDNYAVSENSTNTLSPLVNDGLRTPGGTLSIISVSATNGAASLSGTNVIFIPTLNFVGPATIGYTITDGVGGTNSSLITVTVTNQPPQANPDSYIVAENSGTNVLSPLLNDVLRTPGSTLVLVSVGATNGTAVVNGTNVLFAPTTNFFGVATIGYTITDGIGGTSSSLITVNVTNVPPVANGQSVSTSENTPVTIALTGSDPNQLPLTFAIVGNPANGTLSLLNTNTGTVTYTPGTNYAGADSFTFHVNNGQTNSTAAPVNLSVAPVADLAIVESGPTTGLAGSNLVFTVSVTNRGPATATSLVISNQLSSGFTFVSATGSNVNSGGLVTWLVPSLPVNGVTNFTVTAFATQGGAFTNIASGGSAVLDLNLANNNGSLVNARSLTVITPVADVSVFKTGSANVYAGQSVNYVITATNAGPSTATNVVVQDTLPTGAIFQSASGSYSTNNGVVTWSGVTLAPNAVVTFNLTLLAPATVNSFLNIASATSPTLDPNPTNNNGSFSGSRVTTTVAPSADLVVLLSGPATSIQGSNFVYSLLVTNTGPSVSSNIVVSDSFPSNLVFVSASSGGGFTNNNITWPKILSLAVGATTNYTITAKGLNAGVFTNLAFALATTYDPNSTNNTGVSPASQVQTTVGPAQFNFLAGTPTLNPQTGLYEESVTVTNTGTVTVAGFQLFVGGLRSGVSLYSATGTNNGLPYIQYNSALNPTSFVSLILEFYNPSRLAFTNSLSAVAILPPNTCTSGTNGSVLINRVFLDNRFTPARVVVEFGSVPGKIYTILYSTNLTAAVWKVATPTVIANANVTQWYDDGPPETDSLPGPTRYYRIIQN